MRLWWTALLVCACGSEVIDPSIVCELGVTEPGMPCDVEGQTCGFGDGDCSYQSVCENGKWSEGITNCNDGGAGAGGAAQGGGGEGGEGNAGSGCPQEAPAAGDPCAAVGLCSYGDHPLARCRTTASCVNDEFLVEPAGSSCEPDPTCPDVAPIAGAECTSDGSQCPFSGGNMCTCTTCSGGPCGPPPPHWVCAGPTLGCPPQMPNSGVTCPDFNAGLLCSYGDACNGGQLAECEASGSWQWVYTMCPR